MIDGLPCFVATGLGAGSDRNLELAFRVPRHLRVVGHAPGQRRERPGLRYQARAVQFRAWRPNDDGGFGDAALVVQGEAKGDGNGGSAGRREPAGFDLTPETARRRDRPVDRCSAAVGAGPRVVRPGELVA